MTATTVEFVDPATLSAGDVARWRELSADALEPNLFFSPQYAVPMLELLREKGGTLAVARRNGSWVAAMIVVPTTARLLGAPRRVLTTGGPAIDHFYRTHPLVRPEAPADDLVALFRGIRRLGSGDILHLDDFFADGAFAAAVGDAVDVMRAPVLVDNRGPQAFASRASAIATSQRDEFGPEHLSKNRRNKLRRALVQLEQRAGGPAEYVNLGCGPAAVGEFVALQAKGWKGDRERGGRAIALDSRRVEAFAAAAAASEADDSLFVGGLRAGGRMVYMTLSMRSQDRIVCDVLDAYDEEFRDLSAGSLGRLAHLAYVRRTWPTAEFDPVIRSSAGDVARLYPELRPTAGMYIALGGVGARAVILGAAAVRRRRERER